MMDEAQHALEGVDVLSLIVDASENFGPGDQFSIEWVKRFKGPTFLLLNKVDRVRKPLLLLMIEKYAALYDFAEIYPISALTGEGCPEMVEGWLARLPEAPPYFPADQFTDQPERFLAAEMVREKAILATRDEVPHAIAVLIDSFEEKKDAAENSRDDLCGARRTEGNSDRQARRDHEKDRNPGAQGYRNHPGHEGVSGAIRKGASRTGARTPRWFASSIGTGSSKK